MSSITGQFNNIKIMYVAYWLQSSSLIRKYNTKLWIKVSAFKKKVHIKYIQCPAVIYVYYDVDKMYIKNVA